MVYFLYLDKLQVGYSYTISIDNQFIQTGSFITFPDTKDDLQFELDILYGEGLDLTIFAGRGVCVCVCVCVCTRAHVYIHSSMWCVIKYAYIHVCMM